LLRDGGQTGGLGSPLKRAFANLHLGTNQCLFVKERPFWAA
jgi:hypothetical protein